MVSVTKKQLRTAISDYPSDEDRIEATDTDSVESKDVDIAQILMYRAVDDAFKVYSLNPDDMTADEHEGLLQISSDIDIYDVFENKYPKIRAFLESPRWQLRKTVGLTTLFENCIVNDRQECVVCIMYPYLS